MSEILGIDRETIVEKARDYHNHTHITFRLESLTNLARNGRVNPAVAKIVGALGIRVIGDVKGGLITPVHKIRGDKKISVWAFTKENFDNLTEEEKSKGPRPQFKESTFQAGKVKKGEVIKAKFTFQNVGKKPFGVYKVDIDATKWAHGRIPPTKPGEWTTFTVDINTSDMPEGEMLTIVTLTTNSPLRPIVNLFITGWIE
jgi:hypothetical protein